MPIRPIVPVVLVVWEDRVMMIVWIVGLVLYAVSVGCQVGSYRTGKRAIATTIRTLDYQMEQMAKLN